jgi:hypothetical protein
MDHLGHTPAHYTPSVLIPEPCQDPVYSPPNPPTPQAFSSPLISYIQFPAVNFRVMDLLNNFVFPDTFRSRLVDEMIQV